MSLGLLVLLLLLAGVYAWHARQFQQRQRVLEEQLAARAATLSARETELAARRAELASANKELETFSHAISHDLRAPLRSIDGFGRALVEGYSSKLDAQGLEYVAHLRTASQQMKRLIDDMVLLGRVSRAELNHISVDLGVFAQEIAAELRAREPGRQVEFVIAPGLQVHADRNLIRIALLNLISNAWKFTGKSPRARIEVGVAHAGNEPEFFVRDDGVGFNPAYQAKLFQPFQRLHARSEFDGTGVGLATAARVIERHGGRIWADSQPGHGATFHFTLPSKPRGTP